MSKTPYRRGIEDQPPFWEALGEIARYPLRGQPAVIIAALSVLSMGLYIPVVGALISLFLLLMVPKYALEVLRDSANGHREAPQFGFDMGDRTVFAFLGILLCFYIVHLALSTFTPPAAATVWRLGGAFVLPLIAMSLAIDEQVRRSLNPVFWMTVLSRIGLPYLGVVALLWLGLAVALTGAGILDRILPFFVGSLVSSAVALWAVVAAAHLCGRLLFQYRDRLGFEPSGPEQPEALRHSRDHLLEDRVAVLLKTGDTKNARKALFEEIRERAVSAPLHKQYRNILRAENDRDALIAHGRQWLHQRVFEGDARGALSLVQECLEIDPNFAALDPSDWPPVIAAAERSGMTRLVEAARAAQQKTAPSAG